MILFIWFSYFTNIHFDVNIDLETCFDKFKCQIDFNRIGFT